MWKFWVFWHQIMWFFYWKKLICPKILFFISIRPINLLKMVKENYYNSPDNAAYASTKRNRKLGKEYCVALVTVRNDLEEQFFLTTAITKKTLRWFIQPENWWFQTALKLQFWGNTNCSMREDLLMNKNSQNCFFICQQPLIQRKK